MRKRKTKLRSTAVTKHKVMHSRIELLNIGEKAPEFTLQGIPRGIEAPQPFSLSDYRGKWVVLWFYGSNFTFV